MDLVYSALHVGATPILDLEESPPKWRNLRWIGVSIGAVLGFSLAALPDTVSRALPQLNPLLLIPLIYPAVALHEAGHLLAGQIVGMSSGAVNVGGFILFKSGPRWRVRFDYRSILGGGFAKVLPPRTECRRSAFAWMVAGGPFASILLTGACWTAYSLHGAGDWEWISSLFWVGLLTIIASLLPYSTGQNKSDGARLWSIALHPEQFDPWAALLALQTEETDGTSPRDWNAALVERALKADRAARHYPYVHLLVFYRYLDLGDTSAALLHLENALATSQRGGRVLRQILFLEAAWASASIRGSVAQARAWLARVGTVHEPLSTDAVEGAIAVCERRHSDARRYHAAIRKKVQRRKLGSGLALFALRRLEQSEQGTEEASARQQLPA